MASQRNSPEQHTDTIRVESFTPQVSSFFEGISPYQMELLVSGNPDQTTKVLLAEMLLNIIDSCVQSSLEHLSRTETQILQDDLSAAVADVVPQNLSEAFGDPISSHTSDNLKELLQNEVVENLVSLSFSEDSPTMNTPPQKVDSMVNEAIRMVQRPSSGTSRKPTSLRSTESPKWVQSVDSGQSPRGLEALRLGLSPVTSTDSLETKVRKVVHGTLRGLVDELTGPLTQKLMYYSHQELEEHISEETDKVSSQISAALEAQRSSPEKPPSLEQEQVLQRGLAGKVKTFFAKVFTKALMFRTWGRFEKKAHKDLKEHSKEATDALMEAVDSLLEVREETEDQEGVCYLNIPEGKTLYFTQALTDILYERSTEMDPPLLPTRDPRYLDIQQRVIKFLILVRWWMDTQLEPYSRQVLRALTDGLSSLTARGTEAPLETVEDPRKVHVAVIVKRSIARLLQKADLDCTDLEVHFGWLKEQVWSQLKDQDILGRVDRLEDMHKLISRDVVKRCGGMHFFQVLLTQKSPQVSSCIADSFKKNLQKKRPAICRFFCSLGRALTKPFRRN